MDALMWKVKYICFSSATLRKGLWFITPWGVRWEDQLDGDIQSYLDIIWNLGICFSIAGKECDDFILYSVIIIEHIWWVRNEFFFKDTHPSLD